MLSRLNQWFKLALLVPIINMLFAGSLPAAQADCVIRSVQPETIYAAAWKAVRDSYVDTSFSGQDWSYWEHKFDGQIHSKAAAIAAIDTMLASLHDPYTRIAVRTNNEIVNINQEEQSVSWKLQEKNIGYIKIKNFDSVDCARKVRSALAKLANANSLILDLRGNPGGLVSNALAVADMLLNEGDIVTTVSRQGKQTISASSAPVSKQPLVVLADRNTASASEILIAALKDNHRATIIGSRTFGKGLVQEINVLPAGAVLFVTVSRYLTPGGNEVQKMGIAPDIEVSSSEELAHLATEVLNKQKVPLPFKHELGLDVTMESKQLPQT